MKTATVPGGYECGTWRTMPVWACLVIMAQRPSLGKTLSFWEWKPSNPDHIVARGTSGEYWWISKRDRIMW